MLELIMSAVLTVSVLSYLLGDNILFRLTMHVLVGVGATFAFGVAIQNVLYPRMVLLILNPPNSDQRLAVFGLFGLLGCILLFAKAFRRTAWLGNMAVGYMIGVGAGVALGGALVGTLLPLTFDAAIPSGDANGLVTFFIVVSTIATLLAFTYRRTGQRNLLGVLGRLGNGFLYIAFGATFALVFIASASVLTNVMRGLVVDILELLAGGIG